MKEFSISFKKGLNTEKILLVVTKEKKAKGNVNNIPRGKKNEKKAYKERTQFIY
jgi:hypothetical protein